MNRLAHYSRIGQSHAISFLFGKVIYNAEECIILKKIVMNEKNASLFSVGKTIAKADHTSQRKQK